MKRIEIRGGGEVVITERQVRKDGFKWLSYLQICTVMMGVVELRGDHIAVLYANKVTKQSFEYKEINKDLDISTIFDQEVLDIYLRLYKVVIFIYYSILLH